MLPEKMTVRPYRRGPTSGLRSPTVHVLVASDLHYVLPQLDWILEQAPGYDAVCLVGDLLDVSSRVEPETQIVVVEEYLRRLASVTEVVVCSGNHDLTARNRHGEKHAAWIEDAAGDHITTDWGTLELPGVRITVVPWWDGPLTRADVSVFLAEAARDRPATWVWLYHFPPDDSATSWVGTKHIGDGDLTAWIAAHRPDLVLTGHIHESPFSVGGSWMSWSGSTCVVNPGRQRGPLPAHVIVDLESGRADWWSLAGSEARHIDGGALVDQDQ